MKLTPLQHAQNSFAAPDGTAKPDLTFTADGQPHRLHYKGEMMGAELWEVDAPGQLLHATAIMFTADQGYRERLDHFTNQHTAAKLRAGHTIENA